MLPSHGRDHHGHGGRRGGILPEDLRTSTELLPIQGTCFLRRLVPGGTQRAWHTSLLNVLRLRYDSDGDVSSDRLIEVCG
jgi:hypothetical protein